MSKPEIALGTAQFGMPYGITNASKNMTNIDVENILKCAGKANIHLLDTAHIYGNSEELLGKVAIKYGDFSAITKIPALKYQKKNENVQSFIRRILKTSCERLGEVNIKAVLVHNADDLISFRGHELWDVLKDAASEYGIKKIGVSVYDADQIKRILDKIKPHIIQLPINVLDQRMLQNDYLEYLAKESIEIHIRSVFLQGLILLSVDKVNKLNADFQKVLDDLRKFTLRHDITKLEAALGFIRNLPHIHNVIIGCDNEFQFSQILEAWQKPLKTIDYSDLAINDLDIVDPRRWNFNLG